MGVGMPARKTVEEVLQLSLDSFLEQERARLIEFERQWREGMAAKPMYFPKAMDAGLWDEALSAFDDTTSMVKAAPNGADH